MSRPWFPFYVGDYLRDTARLTTEAHGAYLLLMLDYWVNGAPPDDDEVLATITKLPVTIWKKRRKSLIGFFEIKDGRLTHKRIERERARAKDVGAANSDKARAAANKRWGNKVAPDEHSSEHAPSTTGAMPQNAQSHPPTLSNDVTETRAGPVSAVQIDDSYQPSDRAEEYAYSLGMKKSDLNQEHSKFIAFCMANRITTFNPDAHFKLWCDRWLEHKQRNAAPAVVQRSAPPSAASPAGISAEAFEIAGELEKACGFNLPEEIPPGWCGGALWVQKCLNEGWVGAVMIEATKAVVRRKRNGYVESFKYLEKPLAEAMAQHFAPLPQVEVRQPEKLMVIQDGKRRPPGGDVIQAADRLIEQIKSFDAGPGGDHRLRSGEGETSSRLLSEGGRK